MKIVQIITRMDEAGGAQTHVETLCRSLTEGGNTVVLLSGNAEIYNHEIENFVDSYIEIKHLRRKIHIFHDFLALLEIWKQLKDIKPDILAAHSSKAGIVGRLAAWSLGVPTVFTAHGWAFTDGVGPFKKLVYRTIEKWIGSITDGVIAVSQYDYRLAIAQKVGSKNKMKIIHNGVSDIEGASIPETDPPTIIMVARFAEPKEQSALVQALSEMKMDNWRLRFVGDGPMLSTVKEQAITLGLGNKILFLGSRKDVSSLLASSQIFVLLSKWEGLPISILEAMRSGLPIIASDVGGVNETIVQATNGFLIQRGNQADLIEKCRLLLNDPALRKQMGDASRELYLKNFTLDRMVSETIDFYEQLTVEQ